MSSFVSCDGDVSSPSLISGVVGDGIGGGAPRCTVEWGEPVVAAVYVTSYSLITVCR